MPEVMPIEVSPTVAEGWTLTDTGISHYNDIIQKPEYYAREKGEYSRIISVSPDEALRMGAEAHGVPLVEELRIVDDAVVARYADAMRVGEVMPLPVVDYVAKTQEGRHRILAAKEVGKAEIPLLVIEEPKPPVEEIKSPSELKEGNPILEIDDLLPMSPDQGPPLPKGLGLKWPWKE